MCDFIETHYLDEQVKSIKQLSDWISNLRSMGAPESGMAEYLFDKHTMADEGSQTTLWHWRSPLHTNLHLSLT